MRLWVASLVVGSLSALGGCKEDPACVAHVECGEGLRCIEGTCQMGDAPEPNPPEPTPPEPTPPEPTPPEPTPPEPTPPEPDMAPMDMNVVDGGPDTGLDMTPPDLGPGGPDPVIFDQTIEPILRGRCSSCHPTDATPNDGTFNVDVGMFGNMYEEVQEFLNFLLPEQSELLRKPTGIGHPMIWAVGDDDYNQLLNWIRTGE